MVFSSLELIGNSLPSGKSPNWYVAVGGQIFAHQMKLYVSKLDTIYTCVTRILSTVFYVFRVPGDQGEMLFFRRNFFGCHFYIQIGIIKFGVYF